MAGCATLEATAQISSRLDSVRIPCINLSASHRTSQKVTEEGGNVDGRQHKHSGKLFAIPSCRAQTAEAAVAKLKALVPTEEITRAILVLRRHRVLLDSELAALYGVTTKRFNEQVRRNTKRFPADFMFQLTADEISCLRSQFATLKLGRGAHRKYLPYAFTEHGAIMAATILNSPRAVEMSVFVVRAFVQLREMLASNKELARRFATARDPAREKARCPR
jgi:hypothetical protein